MKYLYLFLLFVPLATPALAQQAVVLPYDESDLQAQIDQLRSDVVSNIGDTRLRIAVAKEELADRLTQAREQIDFRILESKIQSAVRDGRISQNSDRIDDLEELVGAKREQEAMTRHLIYNKIFAQQQMQMAGCQPLPVNITSRRGLLGRR